MQGRTMQFKATTRTMAATTMITAISLLSWTVAAGSASTGGSPWGDRAAYGPGMTCLPPGGSSAPYGAASAASC
jgi:hypothetical protein